MAKTQNIYGVSGNPVSSRIATPYDLTGYTAKLYLGTNSKNLTIASDANVSIVGNAVVVYFNTSDAAAKLPAYYLITLTKNGVEAALCTGSVIIEANPNAQTTTTPTVVSNSGFGATELVINSGIALTGTNVVPPGLYIPQNVTLDKFRILCGSAPTGAGIVVQLAVNGTVSHTATIAAGQTSAVLTNLNHALVPGDLVTFNITAVGSTFSGSDVVAVLEFK